MGDQMALSSKIHFALKQMKCHLDKLDMAGITASRKLIVDAFLELATTNGYNAVTMRQLAKSVNVKASSLYFHFPGGRDEIIVESLRSNYSAWGNAVIDAAECCNSPDAVWDSIVRVYTTRQLSMPGHVLWDILLASDNFAGFLPRPIRKEVDHWLFLVEKLFTVVAVEMGYDADELTIRTVVAALDGAPSIFRWNGEASNLATHVEQAVVITRHILVMKHPVHETESNKLKNNSAGPPRDSGLRSLSKTNSPAGAS
ncbi:TetR/AcrR family transcriptional regulator [Agrobacterium pusense]|uniref:TetR/AcrR family transcriptional regulator n=1 Tax=Agrobacterium pusense TaxID=648995 RepID=UPI003FD6421D